MLKSFIQIWISLLKGFSYPLGVLAVILGIFMISYFIQYMKLYSSGIRPNPTSVRSVKRPGLLKSLFVLTPKQMVVDYFQRPSDFFQPQGLIIFTGRQGRGKTISMVEYMLHLQQSYPKCKVITNLGYAYEDDTLRHWRQLTDYKNDVKGVVVGMDELQNWFGSNQSRNFPPEMLSVVTQNRKNRRVILGTAQNFYLLAKAIRSQTTEVRECMTLCGCLTIVSRKEPILDDKGDVKEWKRRGFYFFVHNKEIRDAYDTYKVIDSLVDSGFKEESKLEVNLL